MTPSARVKTSPVVNSTSQHLLDLARDAAARAYSPYSHFQVGAALVTASGAVFEGCNVENASYGLTICAERTAIFRAIAQEGPGMKLASPRRYFDPRYMKQHFETLYGDEAAGGADGHVSRISPPTRIGYLYQLTAMIGWTSAHFLPFIKQPTLVLMGDKDSIVPLINGRILARLLPRARLEIVEGAGHLFLVTKAEDSARRIRAFLEEPTAAASARGV